MPLLWIWYVLSTISFKSGNALVLNPIIIFCEQGGISQESLSTMIRRDEVTPVRSRRRMYFPHNSHNGDSNKLYYPLGQFWSIIPTLVSLLFCVPDPLHVGRWVKSYFGLMSSVTAIFMTHAIINDNSNVKFIALQVQRHLNHYSLRCCIIISTQTAISSVRRRSMSRLP